MPIPLKTETMRTTHVGDLPHFEAAHIFLSFTSRRYGESA